MCVCVIIELILTRFLILLNYLGKKQKVSLRAITYLYMYESKENLVIKFEHEIRILKCELVSVKARLICKLIPHLQINDE